MIFFFRKLQDVIFSGFAVWLWKKTVRRDEHFIFLDKGTTTNWPGLSSVDTVDSKSNRHPHSGWQFHTASCQKSWTVPLRWRSWWLLGWRLRPVGVLVGTGAGLAVLGRASGGVAVETGQTQLAVGPRCIMGPVLWVGRGGHLLT